MAVTIIKWKVWSINIFTWDLLKKKEEEKKIAKEGTWNQIKATLAWEMGQIFAFQLIPQCRWILNSDWLECAD